MKQPREHQIEARKGIDEALEAANRAKVIMACGTGKTLAELWAIESRDAKLSIVFFPSLGLLSQTFHEWREQQSGSTAFRHICVCSDESVDELPAGGLSDLNDDHVHFDSEAQEFKACTDPAEVRRFLVAASSNTADGDQPRSIVFCTYASAPVVGEAMRGGAGDRDVSNTFDIRPFDLGIFDEAHKTVGVQGKRNAFALQDSNLPIKKRLFFTATQKIITADATPDDPDASRVISMDDEALYGDVAYHLGFGEAARRGLISRFQVVASFVNDATLTPEELASPDAKRIADTRALQLAMTELGARKAITFHSRVDDATAFTDGLNSWSSTADTQGMPAFHVNGGMKSAERDRILAKFGQADTGVMTNATCLTEGIDVPTVDMVAFMDPRQDMVSIAQAAGRAMRNSPGKDLGYVLVPLRVDLAGAETVEQAIDRGNFHQIMHVLRALTEDEESNETWASRLRGSLNQQGDNPPLLRLVGFGDANAPGFVDMHRIRAAISTRILYGDDDARFEQWALQLEAFVDEHGHCEVPKHHPGGLRRWTENQRNRALKDDYPGWRRARLETLGFNFVWDYKDKAFQKEYETWKAFKELHGREPASSSDNAIEKSAGAWAVRVRVAAKRPSFPENRRALLEANGFVWVARDPEATTEEKLRELEAYKIAHGHCNVPAKYRGGLGRWVRRQRYDAKQAGYPDDLRARLDALGFVWNLRDAPAERHLDNLATFKRKHGHCNVPQNYPEGLGTWVSSQRIDAKMPGYSEELRARLDAMGFMWDPRKDRESSRLAELADFHNTHGHWNVPMAHPGGLGIWTSQQRQKSLLPGYPKDRRARLNAMGFDWEFTKDAAEEEWFRKLEEFKAANGHCNVPVNHPSGLGRWVNSQRSTCNKPNYPDARRARLDALGFIWSYREALFDGWVVKLEEFKLTHGHCNVPQTYPGGLGIWVSNQRREAKKDGYPQERRERLDTIGFIWSVRDAPDRAPVNAVAVPSNAAPFSTDTDPEVTVDDEVDQTFDAPSP